MNTVRTFILGNPRSGTSLLRIMLNAHPHIVAPPECGFLQWWHEKYQEWDRKDSKNPNRVKEFVTDVMSSKKIETWDIKGLDIKECIASHRPSSYGELCLCVYLAQASKSETNSNTIKSVVDKNNYYINHTEVLNKTWPEALYIHLIRDGRDVAASYLDLQDLESESPYRPDLTYEIEGIAREWSHNNQHIDSFLKSFSPNRSIRIKYENIIRDPETTLSDVVSFLGLTYSEEMMNYPSHNDEPEATLDWKQNTLKEPDPSRIGRYKDQIEKSDINTFERMANESMIQFGYK